MLNFTRRCLLRLALLRIEHRLTKTGDTCAHELLARRVAFRRQSILASKIRQLEAQ